MAGYLLRTIDSMVPGERLCRCYPAQLSHLVSCAPQRTDRSRILVPILISCSMLRAVVVPDLPSLQATTRHARASANSRPLRLLHVFTFTTGESRF